MPLDTKHLFLTSPELGNQFIFNLGLDLDGPPRRLPHCRIFAGSGPFQNLAAPPCHVPRVAAITIAC